ncbi:hypothetical protein EII17_06925 [Clostridiales bacterium COT073_COT-073]|nr:hypothetical protein EII17_06925 [Clostridiales bacterium COT073_COT-073]
MGIFTKIKEKLQSFWTPYEVTYLGGYDAKALKESENPAARLAEWQAENEEQLAEILPRIRRNERGLLMLERFGKFPERKRVLLEQLARQYSTLRVQKQDAKHSHQEMQGYLSQSGELSYDDDLPRVLKLIEENELEFQKVQKDLSYLEGEKSALEYEFGRNQMGLMITRIVLYMMIIVSILGTIVLFLLSKRQDIFLPAVILILTVGFFGVWSIVFRRYFRSALDKNVKLQQRAVKLLNKVKLKYVRYRSLLDYEYQKFEINSSEALELRYEIFLNEKNQRRRYEDLEKQHRLVALDIAREMETMLPEKEEDLIDLFLQDSDYYANPGGCDKLRDRLIAEKEELRRRLQELENAGNVLAKMKTMLHL